MNRFSRRQFLRRAAAYGGGAFVAPSLAGLTMWNKDAYAATARRAHAAGEPGYGPLVQCENAPEIWIPERFRCVRISETHVPSRANPEFVVPAAIDGMAAFPLANGNIRLIRNHEIGTLSPPARPFGTRPYDAKGGGGTTSLEIAVHGSDAELEIEVVREFPSLTGTLTNCAGGPTPWGSWLSCEETVEGRPVVRHWNGTFGGRDKPHGYVFEVPVAAESEVEPVPLRAMGRLIHEAIAVDPATGAVYETEDAFYDATQPDVKPGAGFYRFLPTRRDELAEGGRLQMLAVDGAPRYNTTSGQTPGTKLPVIWVDIDDPDPADAENNRHAVFHQGHARGAAVFARLEGCWYGDESIYFNSTSGGDVAAGQVWQYRPLSEDRGELMLIFESPSARVLSSPDNICVSPRGGLVICEDTEGDLYIRGLSRGGEIFNLIHQPEVAGGRPISEFAGSCFSPDGSVLFFNIQGRINRPGATYALWGPWEDGAL